MKLYYAETLHGRKACAVARHLDADLEFVLVDLARVEHHSPDFERLNPNRKIPVLVEGDRSFWESNAIMCRLAQLMGSPLWPDGLPQAEVIRWLSWDAVQFTRFGGELYFENLIKPHVGLGAPDKSLVRAAQDAFRASASVLEGVLGERDWVTGPELSIADFALGSALPYAGAAQIPLQQFPQISRWYGQLSELEAWRDPFPPR